MSFNVRLTGIGDSLISSTLTDEFTYTHPTPVEGSINLSNPFFICRSLLIHAVDDASIPIASPPKKYIFTFSVYNSSTKNGVSKVYSVEKEVSLNYVAGSAWTSGTSHAIGDLPIIEKNRLIYFIPDDLYSRVASLVGTTLTLYDAPGSTIAQDNQFIEVPELDFGTFENQDGANILYYTFSLNTSGPTKWKIILNGLRSG